MEDLLQAEEQAFRDLEKSVIPKRIRALKYGANIALFAATGIGAVIGGNIGFDHTQSYEQMQRIVSVDEQIATTRSNGLNQFTEHLKQQVGSQCVSALTPYVANGPLAYENLPTITSQLFNEKRCSTNGINIALKIKALRFYESSSSQANVQLNKAQFNLANDSTKFEGVVIGSLYAGTIGGVIGLCLYPFLDKRFNRRYETKKSSYYQRMLGKTI